MWLEFRRVLFRSSCDFMSLFSARKRGMAYVNVFVLVFFRTQVRYFHFFLSSKRIMKPEATRYLIDELLKVICEAHLSLIMLWKRLRIVKFRQHINSYLSMRNLAGIQIGIGGITYGKQHQSPTIFQSQPDKSFILKQFWGVIITSRQQKLYKQMFPTHDSRTLLTGSKRKASSFFKISSFVTGRF